MMVCFLGYDGFCTGHFPFCVADKTTEADRTPTTRSIFYKIFLARRKGGYLQPFKPAYETHCT